MMTDEDIKKYQELCQQNLGITLSVEEARKEGSFLLHLLELTYQPITKAAAEKFSSKQVDLAPDAIKN